MITKIILAIAILASSAVAYQAQASNCWWAYGNYGQKVWHCE